MNHRASKFTIAGAVVLSTIFLSSCTEAQSTTGQRSAHAEEKKDTAPRFAFRHERTKKWGFVDRHGTVAVDPIYKHAVDFVDGLAMVHVKSGRAKSDSNWPYGFIDKSGNIVIEPKFAEAFSFHEGLAAVRLTKTTIYGKGDK